MAHYWVGDGESKLYIVFTAPYNDGDIDVLCISYDDVSYKLDWFENDGSQNFTAHAITSNLRQPDSVYGLDEDNDRDIDVVSAALEDDKIAWYENNGSQSFTAANITTSADGANSVFVADIDNDGRMDIL